MIGSREIYKQNSKAKTNGGEIVSNTNGSLGNSISIGDDMYWRLSQHKHKIGSVDSDSEDSVGEFGCTSRDFLSSEERRQQFKIDAGVQRKLPEVLFASTSEPELKAAVSDSYHSYRRTSAGISLNTCSDWTQKQAQKINEMRHSSHATQKKTRQLNVRENLFENLLGCEEATQKQRTVRKCNGFYDNEEQALERSKCNYPSENDSAFKLSKREVFRSSRQKSMRTMMQEKNDHEFALRLSKHGSVRMMLSEEEMEKDLREQETQEEEWQKKIWQEELQEEEAMRRQENAAFSKQKSVRTLLDEEEQRQISLAILLSQSN